MRLWAITMFLGFVLLFAGSLAGRAHAQTADAPAAPAAPAATATVAAPAAPSTITINNPPPAAPAAPSTSTSTNTTVVEHDAPHGGTHGFGMPWIVGGVIILVALVAMVGMASTRA
jgi:hypothetical protein